MPTPLYRYLVQWSPRDLWYLANGFGSLDRSQTVIIGPHDDTVEGLFAALEVVNNRTRIAAGQKIAPKGIYYNTKRGVYEARISINNKVKYLGRSETKEGAQALYDDAVAAAPIPMRSLSNSRVRRRWPEILDIRIRVSMLRKGLISGLGDLEKLPYTRLPLIYTMKLNYGDWHISHMLFRLGADHRIYQASINRWSVHKERRVYTYFMHGGTYKYELHQSDLARISTTYRHHRGNNDAAREMFLDTISHKIKTLATRRMSEYIKHPDFFKRY